MEKPKVLIVYHFIALYRKAIFDELIKSEKYDYTFLCDSTGKDNIEVVDSKFFQNKKYIKVRNRYFKNILWQQGLIKHILFNKYDAIIFLADPNFLSTWIASIICKIKNQKVLFWTHGFIRGKSAKDKLKLIFYKLADKILLYGDKAKNRLILNRVPANKLATIYNSLDYNTHKHFREITDIDNLKLFQNPNLPQIIFIGRLTKQKKLTQLIELIVALNNKGLKINLLFVGDGEERKNLENLTKKYNIEEQIHFYGKTYNEKEIAPLIMSSDVCISPGEIGLTAMHVLSYGVPVITHDNELRQMPEYEAIINGKNGRLYKYGNFDSLVEESIKFFKSDKNNIKQNCIKIIEERYTPQAQKKFIENSLDEILKDNK